MNHFTAINSAHEELIGTLLMYPDSMREYTLHPELFFGYAWLYRIMQDVQAEEGFTYRGLIERLNTNQLQTAQFLKRYAVSEGRIPLLVKQSRKDVLQAKLKLLSAKLSSSEEDPDETLRELQKEVATLETSDAKDSSPDNDLEDFFSHMDAVAADPSKAYGLLTGVSDLDTLTTGFHRTDFSVVGARTSMGKSAFMLQIALNLHMRGFKVGIFSLEMSKRQIYTRLMANLMDISAEVFKLGKAHPSYYQTMRKHKEQLQGLFVDDSRGVTSEYIADSMRKLKRTQGLDFVVVDYLQDVKEQGEANDNSGSALARVCRKLRKAAQDCDCHLMGLSQVTRAAEQTQDKRPGNADLSGSTGIETSADVIALLYREDYYNPDTPNKNILEVNFTKQRNGRTGKVELHYDRNSQRIRGLSR